MGAFSHLRDHKNINQVRKGAFEKQNKVKLGRKDLVHNCGFFTGMISGSFLRVTIIEYSKKPGCCDDSRQFAKEMLLG